MVKRWDKWRNPWDREYAMRGSLWRGVAGATFLHPWIAQGSLVLELGCGDGKFVAGLRAAGYEPLGVDFARRALLLARTHASRLAVGDARRLPLRSGRVPAIAARYLLGAMLAEERRQSAREIERVLAIGGVLVVEEFGARDFRKGTGREVEPRTFERNQGILTHYFEPAEVPQLFPHCKLEHAEPVLSTQRIGSTRAARHAERWILRRRAGALHESNGGQAGR